MGNIGSKAGDWIDDKPPGMIRSSKAATVEEWYKPQAQNQDQQEQEQEQEPI